MIKQTTCLVLLLLLFYSGVSAQNIIAPQTLNSGGGSNDDPSSYYRYEWSIGEAAVIQTFTSPTLTVTAGVLQPGTNTGVINNSNHWGTEEIKLFPNPVVTELEISILSKQSGKVNMMLYDAAGKLVGIKQFDYYGIGQITKWNFSQYSVGHYVLKVTLDAATGSIGKTGAFKIEKLTN